MNGDLISREALLKEYEWLMTQTSECNKPVLQEHLDRINWQPAVDAEPVKHGKWDDLCRGKMRVCSCCKHHFDNTCNDIDGEWIFCPNCGAKMDLED